MANGSLQKKVGRVRPPRVQIDYEVSTGGATEKKQLPFVMGVLGNFTGDPKEPLKKLKERKFVSLTPDNFDQVLADMKPHLTLSVENTLSDDADAKLNVDLNFSKLSDFSPDGVARQVGPLREALDLRTALAELRGRVQTNEELEELVQQMIKDPETLKKLKEQLGAAKGDETPDKPEGDKE